MDSVAQLLNSPSCSRVVAPVGANRSMNVHSWERASTSKCCHPSHQSPHFPFLPRFEHSFHIPNFQSQCSTSPLQSSKSLSPNEFGKTTNQPRASATRLTSSLTTPLVCAGQSGIFGINIDISQSLQRRSRGQSKRGGALVTTNAMQMTRLKPPEETAAPPGQKGYPQHVKFAIDEICELAPRASLAKAMGNIQTKLSPGDWQYVFKELQQRRDWQRASRVFKYMQRQPINQPTEHLYTLMMSIFGREGMLDKAQEVFDEMPRYGVPRNVYSYTALINAYGKNAQYPRSLELLADMKRARIMPNVVTYNTIINACAKGGYEWEGLLDLFGQMRHEGIQPDLITYNTLIAACADRGLLEQAGMIFKVMIEAGCIPDTLTYTSLMAAFSSEERYNDMADLLFWMEDVGTLPDVTAYNILINAYGKAGQFREASATFKRMKRAGVSPTVVTYSTLLDALGKYGQYESVREIFREMVASECAPNVVTFNTMIDAFGRGGHYKEAVDLFESMEETGVEPDHITYKGLLAACGMGALAKEAAKLERHIRRRGFPATVDMYNSMIEAYSKAALYEEALSVLDGMTEAKVEPDEATYSLLLGMFGKAGLHREAAEMFWKMHDRGFLPGVPTYNALIDAYGRGGLLEEAEHVYEDMLEAKKAPSLGTFAALSAAIAAKGDGESAGDLYSDMAEGGYKPDGPPFCNLIAAYAKIRDVDNVARLLREMAAPRQSLEVSTLAGLLVGRYDDDYRWQEVEFVLEAQRDRGLSDNMVFYNALLDALWELGQHARAVKIVRAALARGTFPEAVKRSDMIWAIDVHRMSGGAALALLYSWLGEMRALRKKRVKKGEEPPPDTEGIPDTLSVVAWVGLSKASPRDVPVYQAINVALSELAGSTSNFPFQPAPWSEGRWIASGPAASKWLAGVKLGRKLELDDAPLPELFVDIVERGALR